MLALDKQGACGETIVIELLRGEVVTATAKAQTVKLSEHNNTLLVAVERNEVVDVHFKDGTNTYALEARAVEIRTAAETEPVRVRVPEKLCDVSMPSCEFPVAPGLKATDADPFIHLTFHGFSHRQDSADPSDPTKWIDTHGDPLIIIVPNEKKTCTP